MLARLELPRGGAEENAFWVGVTLNPEHSAQLRRIGEWSSWSRVKTDDLGDGATKSCGGRAQMDNASDSITPWMNSGDACDGPLGWRRKLVANEHEFAHSDWWLRLSALPAGLKRCQVLVVPPGPEILRQLADQEPALSCWDVVVDGISFRNYKCMRSLYEKM